MTDVAGGLERYFATWNHLNFYYNVGITGYYILKPFSSVTSLEKTIYNALAFVIQKHPILSTVITDADTPAPFFAHLPSFDLKNVVSIIERQKPYPSGNGRDVELDELLETPHNEAFENDKSNSTPFWRLLILTNPIKGGDHAFTASFVYHHSICDGSSGLIFHQHFLEALNSSRIPHLRSAIMKTAKTELMPEIEKMIRFPVSFKKLLKTFVENKFPSLPRGVWAGGAVATTGERHFRSFTISPEVTSGFIAACKSNGTTVQATLQVLAAASLFSILPPKFKRLDCTVAVSLRRFLDGPVTDSQMGTFNSSAFDHYERSAFETGGFRWNEAHRARDVVAAYMESKGKDDLIGLLRYVGNYEKFCWDRVGKPRLAAFEISNIGAFKKEPEATDGKPVLESEHDGLEWSMGRMIFSQSAGVMSAAILVSVVTGGDGCLTLGFAWQERIVDQKIVEAMMNKMQKGLMALGSPSSG